MTRTSTQRARHRRVADAVLEGVDVEAFGRAHEHEHEHERGQRPLPRLATDPDVESKLIAARIVDTKVRLERILGDLDVDSDSGDGDDGSGVEGGVDDDDRHDANGINAVDEDEKARRAVAKAEVCRRRVCSLHRRAFGNCGCRSHVVARSSAILCNRYVCMHGNVFSGCAALTRVGCVCFVVVFIVVVVVFVVVVVAAAVVFALLLFLLLLFLLLLLLLWLLWLLLLFVLLLSLIHI